MIAYALLAGMFSALTIALMLQSGRAGPLDQPNHRSLHAIPVPRSGGVGILVGVLVGLVVAAPTWPLIAGLLLLVAISWLDDRHSLPVVMRFASHFFAAGLAVVAGIAPDWGGWELPLVLLFIVWMTNLYNFMDGANGLAGGMALFGFGAYAAAAGLAGEIEFAIFSACIAAAAAGFLIFNFDPARIFMGDIGSIPLGFLAATLGLDGLHRGIWPLWFPLLVFAPFIVDATVTLMRRAWRRERIWQAHREHYYQRLVRSGWSHRKLALHEYGLMAAVAASACWMLKWPLLWQAVGLTAWVVVLGGLMLMIETIKHDNAI
jgi:UDP-N-acetylmuramyl pentapeptide phosphotransferase/UDP-N-acetylglucosamine-1-phosphate transferase